MTSAEIIAIGTELLLGEIQDTNTHYLARSLRDAGIDLYRTTIVGDNLERIAQAIREATSRANIVISTGGLGPTVDDPTRQAVALAIGTDTEFKLELWHQIQARFKRFNRQATENNRRQAYIPAGAIAVENPVGTAPAFIVEKAGHVIISLPGVPSEMEFLMEHTILPYLKEHFDLKGTIKARVLHVSGVGESQVDEWIGDLETMQNPTVGLLAHPGQVDVRVTAKANSIEEANQMIDEMIEILRQRLGDSIYGMDDDLLENATLDRLITSDWHLIIVECGLRNEFLTRLNRTTYPSENYSILSTTNEKSTRELKDQQLTQLHEKDVLLSAILKPGPEKQGLVLFLKTPVGERIANFSYGGPPINGIPWAVNMSLDFIRRNIP
jgi:competence/damage-inducible protein CinA-like protein